MKYLLLLLLFTFSSCEKLQEMGQENFKKNVTPKTPSEAELEKWKQKLALEEAEIKELDEKIRKMVRKTKEAGVLSWKIAQGYMRVGNYELSSRYYTQAIQQNMDNKVDVVGSEVHFFEGAIPFLKKHYSIESLLMICFSKLGLLMQMLLVIEVGTKSVVILQLPYLKDSFVKIRLISVIRMSLL